MINFILLISRQGKLRLAKWYATYNLKERQKLIKEVTALVMARKPRACNFIEYRDQKIVYKRYASLFFVAGIDAEENELLVLETLHRYVETLDRHFENVCELDLIFNFMKAHYVLDEFIVAGEVQEPSMKAVLRSVQQADEIELEEQEERRFF
jgi:hypothetical protein